jgi:hypothetical protein
MLSTEQLMLPRWKIKVDFPGSYWNVGDIVTGRINISSGAGYLEFRDEIIFPENWPGCFYELGWWEYRNVNEMPSYLKVLEGTRLVQVHTHCMNWHSQDFIGTIVGETRTHQMNYRHFIPATQEEFEQACSQVKK